MSDKDGGNVSVLNERMMLGWHVANPVTSTNTRLTENWATSSQSPRGPRLES